MGNATIWDFASVSELANILGVMEKMVTSRKKRMSEENVSGLQPFCGVPTKKKRCDAFEIKWNQLITGIIDFWVEQSKISPNKADVMKKHDHTKREFHARPRMPDGHRKTVCKTDRCQVHSLFLLTLVLEVAYAPATVCTLVCFHLTQSHIKHIALYDNTTMWKMYLKDPRFKDFAAIVKRHNFVEYKPFFMGNPVLM